MQYTIGFSVILGNLFILEQNVFIEKHQCIFHRLEKNYPSSSVHQMTGVISIWPLTQKKFLCNLHTPGYIENIYTNTGLYS